jgi:hypothetical protein
LGNINPHIDEEWHENRRLGNINPHIDEEWHMKTEDWAI